VIVSLPVGEYGLTSAAAVAQALRSTLPHIRIGMMVGIGAGIPGEVLDAAGKAIVRRDIRLGDVVVSEPSGTSGGVVQLDLVKMRENVGQVQPHRTGMLNSPPMAMRTALSKMKARHERRGSTIPAVIAQAMQVNPRMAARYAHPGLTNSTPANDICHFRDGSVLQQELRAEPEIHYGIIGSSNILEKSAKHRDQIVDRLAADGIEVMCIEMEAAGLMNNFPCLVVRGICDYADSNKNDDWQRYAAMVAAAFSKEYLGFVQPVDVEKSAPLGEIMQGSK
jgi:nucleoside phosphorylase